MRAHRVVIVGLLLASLLAAMVGGHSEWSRQMGLGVHWLRTVALVGATLVGFSWAATGGVLTWLRPRNPVASILAKLHVRDRAAAVARARDMRMGQSGTPLFPECRP